MLKIFVNNVDKINNVEYNRGINNKRKDNMTHEEEMAKLRAETAKLRAENDKIQAQLENQLRDINNEIQNINRSMKG